VHRQHVAEGRPELVLLVEADLPLQPLRIVGRGGGGGTRRPPPPLAIVAGAAECRDGAVAADAVQQPVVTAVVAAGAGAGAAAVGVVAVAEFVVAAAVLVADVRRLALVGLRLGLAVPREPALHPRPAVGQRLPARVLIKKPASDRTLANRNEKKECERAKHLQRRCDRFLQ
jgi:hypothetical protein